MKYLAKISRQRYFDHLTTKTAMERHTLFVQMTPDLFQNDSLCSSSKAQNFSDNPALPVSHSNEPPEEGPSPRLKHSPYEADVEVHNKAVPQICPLSEIYVRRERQTFTRLPVSDAILFTVRTFMTPLTSLGDDELTAFVEQARGWGSEMAAYKGREQWWDTVIQYYQVRKSGMAEEHKK
jgi:hypothetical protein